MITANTVFVLGAGAHKPYGFPTGEELKLDIIRLLQGDRNEPDEAGFMQLATNLGQILRGHKGFACGTRYGFTEIEWQRVSRDLPGLPLEAASTGSMCRQALRELKWIQP